MKKIALLVGAVAVSTVGQVAWAQNAPAPAPVVDTSGVEKSVESLRRPSVSEPRKSNALPDNEVSFSLAILQEVQVKGDLLSQEIRDYWAPFVGKPVSSTQMTEFKKWVYQKLDNRGYLGYVQTSQEKATSGSLLVVQVVPITVGKVTVLARDPELASKYSKEVARRLSARFAQGQVLDVADLEAQLNAVAYDLPVVLDAELRTDGRRADLAINMTEAPYKAGRVQGGLVQLNNYGLNQYGRVQALGAISIDGFTPLSSAAFAGMVSERVRYLRAEYDHPLSGTGTHLHGWASVTGSSSEAGDVGESRSEAFDYGASLTGLLHVDGSSTTQWSAELARRDARDTVADIQTSKSVDYQLRARLKTNVARSRVHYLNNELSLVAGNLDLSGDENNYAFDQATYQRDGAYQKLELQGALSRALSEDQSVFASVRWHAQLASKNLSTYNQIALGGPNGIRAYTTADGAGDSGAVLSFDLTKAIHPNLRIGVLYDIGRVQLTKNPNVLGAPVNNEVELQGAGFQLGGDAGKFTWNASAAKSFGASQDTLANPNLSTVGEWRFNLEVTRSF